MKRLILLSMMLISAMMHADDIPTASATNQSSSDNIAISISNIHHINLDNTEIDSGGNWLNKRIWYERSQTIFDEIRVLVSTVTELRIQFSNEVNAVGQKIDVFFETVNFVQGELDDKFKDMIVALDVKQKLVGDLVEEERALQASIKQALPAVDQIEKDIKLIGEVDKKIDQTFLQACKTIDECRDYETKSWDAFKAIAKELDDKKARNLYYQMNNYKQNIDQKSTYLKSTLLPYLHNVLVAKIEKNISAINRSVEALKIKGFDLEKIMKKNQEDDIQELQKREKQAADIAVRKALEEEQEKAKIIAEKAAHDLEDANKKSFSNVVHAYYDATVGKIIGFFQPGYEFIMRLSGVSFITNSMKSYSFPFAKRGYNLAGELKSYMHEFVEHVMSYFGVKPKKSQINQGVQQEAKSEVKADIAIVPSTTVQPEQKSLITEDVSNVAKSDGIINPVNSTSSSEITSAITDQEVVVQSISNHYDDDHKKNTVGAYQLFMVVLDFIGTIIMSVYNCFVQFLKLLFNFSMYLIASN